jgi:hypothetical protein
MGTYANILLTLILLSILSGLLFVAVICMKIRGVFNEFRQFISAPDEKTPSPLAQLVSAMSDIAARSIVARIKATFMGKQSGAVRAEGAVDEAIAQDQVNGMNPLLGSVLDSFPTLKKSLLKNPALIDFALSKFGNLGGTGNGSINSSQPSDNNHNGQVKFKL